MTPSLRRTFLFVLCLTAITGYAFAQALTVSPDTYTTQQDTPLVVPAGMGVLANDTGYDSATHRLESYDPLSQYGAVITLAADGSFTYTPEPGFVGLDTFGYTVRNSFGATVGVVSISVTPPPGLANDDSYTLTPHLTFVSPTSVTANDVDATSITGFGDSLGTANGTPVNGSNFITAGGAGGRVVLNPDGTFTYYPDAGDVNTSATFFYTINSLYAAEVTLTFTNQEQVWVVDSTPSGAVCTGGNSGTPACPFANFGDAWGGTSTANDTILVDSGAYTCGVTLLNGQRVLGAGTSGTIEAATALTPQPGSAYAPYGTFSGTRPTLTVSIANNCFNLGQNNIIRGLNIGDTPSNRYALSGNNLGTLTVSQVAISGTGGLMFLNTGTLAATFDSLATTSSTSNAISIGAVGGSLTVTGTTSLSNIADNGIYVVSSSLTASFTTLNINAVTGSNDQGIYLEDNTNLAFSFTANGGTIQNTNSHNILIANSGNVSLTDMTLNTPGVSGNNINVTSGRGTNSLTRVTMNGSQVNGLGISSNFGSSTWTLTNVDCTTSTMGTCISADIVISAFLNLNLLGTSIGESILRSNDDAIVVNANGFGAQVRVNMDRVRLTNPIGTTGRRGGLFIQAENGGSVNYVVQRSEFLNLYPDSLDGAVVFINSSTDGDLRGRFSSNTITSNNVTNNRGLYVGLSGADVFELRLDNNVMNMNSAVPAMQFLHDGAVVNGDVELNSNTIAQNYRVAEAPLARSLDLQSIDGSSGDVRFNVDSNTFTTNAVNTAEAAYVLTSGANGFLGLGLTFTDNGFDSGNLFDFSINHESSLKTTCAAFTGNSGNLSPSAIFTQTTGTFQVANLGSLAANNPAMTVITSGTLTNVTACPNVVLSGTIPAFPNLLP